MVAPVFNLKLEGAIVDERCDGVVVDDDGDKSQRRKRSQAIQSLCMHPFRWQPSPGPARVEAPQAHRTGSPGAQASRYACTCLPGMQENTYTTTRRCCNPAP